MIPFIDQVYVSAEAKQFWEPVFNKLIDFWFKLEIISVYSHDRVAALGLYSSEDLYKYSLFAHEKGLHVLPLELNPEGHRVLITRFRDVEEGFVKAWKDRDERKIGWYLQYPKCCIDFFATTFKIKQDTCQTMESTSNGDYIPSNIFLRDLGIRPVFHLPCSLSCPSTKRVAEALQILAMNSGYGKEIDAVYSILDWPIKYSALHGVAEITTPVVKIRRNTDYTAKEFVLEFHGNTYPELGASGIKFPFVNNPKRKFVALQIPDTWSDNGFPNKLAMDTAHEMVLGRLRAKIDRTRSITIMDLGCGNGQLLKRITKEFPNVIPMGVDKSVDKISSAKSILPNGFFTVTNLGKMEFDRTYDLVLISKNRFDEVGPAQRLKIRNRLKRIFKKIIIYSYDEMQIKEEIDGWDQTADGTASSVAQEDRPSPRGDAGSGDGDDSHGRSQDQGGAAGFVPDWAVKAREDSH